MITHDILHKKQKTARGTAISYLISAPCLILIALIVVFPILYTGYISLTNMNTYHWFNYSLIGLDNYRRALLVFYSFYSYLLYCLTQAFFYLLSF